VAGHPGQVQVQHHQIGPRCVSELFFAPKERQSLFTSSADMQPVLRLPLGKRRAGQKNIALVILDEKDICIRTAVSLIRTSNRRIRDIH